jgi:hypothetical protein
MLAFLDLGLTWDHGPFSVEPLSKTMNMVLIYQTQCRTAGYVP